MRPCARCKCLFAWHNFFLDSILSCKTLDIKSTFFSVLFIDVDVILRTISILTYMNLSFLSFRFKPRLAWKRMGLC